MKTPPTTDLGHPELLATASLDTAAASPSAPAGTRPSAEVADAESTMERLAMRGDPLAVALYRFLQSRPQADLRHVLNAVAGRRGVLGAASRMGVHAPTTHGDGPSAEGERVALCRMSLEAAAADLERFPSRREYDRWRDTLPNPAEFASASFIRRAFNGSWTVAIGQLGAPTADFAARRLLMGGKSFTPRERDRALRLFLDAVPAGQRTQASYRAWARGYVQQPGAFDVPLAPAHVDVRCWALLVRAAGRGRRA